MKLWRPTGVEELRLVRDSGWLAWPPRLPDQPIFYPVTSFDYAEKIARDWNATGQGEHGYGFVTEFDITPVLAAAYPVQLAGGRAHSELWIPAADLTAFNEGIVGPIRVVAAYRDRAKVETERALRELGL